MANDIAPELAEQIIGLFTKAADEDKTIAAIIERIIAEKATPEDIQRLAIALGNSGASALQQVLTAEVLPDGKLYYNIADRTIRPLLEKAHERFNASAVEIQSQLNTQAGIGIKAVQADLNEQKVKGIIDKVSNAESLADVEWMLNEPLKVLVQSFADDFVRANAEFQADSGLSPKIKRTVYNNCCAWCKALSGEYLYSAAPDDIFRRHEQCRCLVTFDPRDGSKRGVQNVHTKKWTDLVGQELQDMLDGKTD